MHFTHQSSVSSQTQLAHAWHSCYTTLLSIGVDGAPLPLSVSVWTASNDTRGVRTYKSDQREPLPDKALSLSDRPVKRGRFKITCKRACEVKKR